jgi:hypothetical protein
MRMFHGADVPATAGLFVCFDEGIIARFCLLLVVVLLYMSH